MSLPGPSNAQEPNTHLNLNSFTNLDITTFKNFIELLIHPNSKDETKLKVAQELCENFEIIFIKKQYPSLIEPAINVFLKFLSKGKPHFIAEYHIQQVRKLILEMVNRLPSHDVLKSYEKQIFALMMKLLEIENEENVLICLRIIIDLLKHSKPTFSLEIQNFLKFVRTIYKNLPNHLPKIFASKQPIQVNDLSDLNLENLLSETFTVTVITEDKLTEGNTTSTTSYNLIPRGILSLKVLQELPIIVLLMYQLYQKNLEQEIAKFIQLIMSTIMLQPTRQQMKDPSFNKEVFVDFMGAQIKTVSFLAYLVKIFQEVIAQNSTNLIGGMLELLSLCPMEVAHLRKELLIATRHFIATDLRTKFVPFMDRLCDEDLLLGKGWTTHESLRPLAYSTLADIIHHVRTQLPVSFLARAVHLFSKNVHDESLPTNIQTMSCRLLLNLVICIKQRSDQEDGQARYILIRMLEVFVLKFKTIAKLHIPILINKSKTQETNNSGSSQSQIPPPTALISNIDKIEDNKTNGTINSSITEEKEKSKFGFPICQSANYTVVECRDLVKTLVCGVRSITWGCAINKVPPTEPLSIKFPPKETLIFIRLVKWALQALDIYTIPYNGQNSNSINAGSSGQRPFMPTKEESHVLEHFAGVFSMLSPVTFKEIFFTSIDFMVERFYKNFYLEIVFNTFLSPPTSPVFAYILLEYLQNRLEEMGSNQDKSNLYLRLFRMVFASVSLFPQENDHMLRPRLQQIVNKSMELAMSAKEPYNYFLLLRALFRAIGSERNHDLLYLEFLPLLPTLLQGLNNLQSGPHKQHMKDLFIELCLIVPVRLSSLLPYLPMLMDPLVSALNGSQNLITQGLKTLELCVDNLQPDFLYEHIQPVRAELMQALWKIVRNSSENIAQTAFRILGKIGGANRKMMIEPQRLEYVDEGPGPLLVVHFQEYKSPINLPIHRIIETAYSTLKSTSTDIYYIKQSWEVIKCYLVATLNLDCTHNNFNQLFTDNSFIDPNKKLETIKGLPYKYENKLERNTLQTALTGMFIAAGINEMSQIVLPTLVFIVTHYIMVAISQQAGPHSLINEQINLNGMDILVLIDALADIMGYEEKEFCKVGSIVLKVILFTTLTIMGTKHRACQLSFMEYLNERMCSLCYKRSWYAKMGGCIAIKYLFDKMSMIWVFEHLFVFLKALLFVMMDLTGEVSYGAIDMAKSNLEKMIIFCGRPIERRENNDDLIAAQEKALFEVTNELMLQVISSNTLIREHSMYLLKILANVQNKTVPEIITPHKKAIEDMIPPKKHVLRHQPVNVQIGIMDGTTFCTTLEPRLFEIDITKTNFFFFYEVMSLCETEDANLMKLACYKSVTNLTTLRKCALRTLSSCHYLISNQNKILLVLYKSLEKNNPEIQQAAYECLKTFITGMHQNNPAEIEDKTSSIVLPLLNSLGNYNNLGLTGVKRLYYIALLFPNQFDHSHCKHMLNHFKSLIEVINVENKDKGVTKNGENEQKIITTINIFTQIPVTPPSIMEILCELILGSETILNVEASSTFREPLLKFLLRFPSETIELFLSNSRIKNKQWNRYLKYLIKHELGKPFRDILQKSSRRLIEMIKSKPYSDPEKLNDLNSADCLELHYQTIRITSILIKYDEQWLSGEHQLVSVFKEIWCDAAYQERLTKIESIEYHLWNEPKLLVKILLHFFCHHTNEIELLFQLLRAFCSRYLSDFQFLRDFLEKTVARDYTVDWKRSAFFKFVELFHGSILSQELKSKVLQFILIPCFSVSFERSEGDRLIGGPASPDQENPDNVVSVFISKVIEPESTNKYEDCVRILLLQFSCLLVEQASAHIHHAEDKNQGSRLRQLIFFAWPCLLVKNCADPTTRYHCYLLLSHIIAKFAIYKKIVLQVFHRLLKAHTVEARTVVRQALEILTPAMPYKMDDGYKMLIHWTKKIYSEEGPKSMQQLLHILQLIIRHYKIYYPVRHHLIQDIITSMRRLGFSPNGQIEHRRVSVELAEVIIKWELQRIRDESKTQESIPLGHSGKRPAPDDGESVRKRQTTSVGHTSTIVPNAVPKIEPNSAKPIEKSDSDSVLNFLLQLACQENNPKIIGSEVLSKRCVALLKMALRPDVWPHHSDLKLNFLDDIFQSIESSTPNLGNICTALDLLTYLLGVMTQEHILISIKSLHKGIIACITSSDSKVVRLVYSLLSSLMKIFPTHEVKNATNTDKFSGLESLYSNIEKVISEGLSNYENDKSAPPSTLFGTLMVLKAACSSNQYYIDKFIVNFMRVLSRMVQFFIKDKTDNSPVTCELLILSLDLIKNRIQIMSLDTRKNLINKILLELIENSKDLKIAKSIAKTIDEWIKNSNISSKPSMQELSLLLLKMLEHFPFDSELNNQFLETINFIYRDNKLKFSELSIKLESAFLSGLRCNNPELREKFFEVFDLNIDSRIYERILYIVTSQNWESMGTHYWIKQCIQIILNTVQKNTPLTIANKDSLLPGATSVLSNSDKVHNSGLEMISCIKKEIPELDSSYASNRSDQNVEMDMSSLDSVKNSDDPIQNCNTNALLIQMFTRQQKKIEHLNKLTTKDFLLATIQLCHLYNNLAERVWLDLFPNIWQIITDDQQKILIDEIVPFVYSASHLAQRDCKPSAINTFMEAISRCNISHSFKPPLFNFLGKTHNLWHRMALILETLENDSYLPITTYYKTKREELLDDEVSPTPQQELLDSLSNLLWDLKEEDMWAALWQRHARYRATTVAIAYEQQGFYEQAQSSYEIAMSRARSEYGPGPLLYAVQKEVKLCEEHWIRCAKELSQWDVLLEFASDRNNYNPYLLIESAWHLSKWQLMKDSLQSVTQITPKENTWKLSLFQGFLSMYKPEEQDFNLTRHYVDLSTKLCIQEWSRYPQIVSHMHIPILQGAQQIIELQESIKIYTDEIQGDNVGLKRIVKLWRNRLPIISDPLSHWSEIFHWRKHNYQYLANKFQTSNQSLLGVHANAQTIVHFGKIARKHNLIGVCLDNLSSIYNISNISTIDCFQKIRQQIKCYVQMASIFDKNQLQEGLDVIEDTQHVSFPPEMNAEFFAFKGMLLAYSGRSEEANKAFSTAVKLHDTLVKAWALWGDYLEHIFTRDPKKMIIGVSAITCFLHACRHQNESKSRKYLAKILWLLIYDDDKFSLMQALNKYSVGVPPIQWLPWIPQLLTWLVRDDENLITNLLNQVGRMFPQALFFPIRTVYLTLKIELKSAESAATKQQQSRSFVSGPLNENSISSSTLDHMHNQIPISSNHVPNLSQNTTNINQTIQGESCRIKASPFMERCLKIMKIQREIHPIVISSLNGIVDQMLWFRESCYEEVLRQLRQGLAKCLTIAFENRENVAEATVTQYTINFIKKLVIIFDLAKNASMESSGSTSYITTGNESLASRARASVQDPDFQKLKDLFASDFNFSIPGSMKVRNLISKIRKWINILESKVKTLPKSFLIEEKCRFLSTFTLQTAEVELPGEFLLPRHSHYYVRLAGFLPRVDILQKHNTTARRLFIKGHNGKIYPYLVVNGSGLGDARSDERVLQLLRMLNHFLIKQKETSRRFLHFTVPRVVAVYPQMRLIEDTPSSLSYLDIFKNKCKSLGFEHDAPILRYYEYLDYYQSKGIQTTYQGLLDIFKNIQSTMVPNTILRDWALQSFPSALDYWTFRKTFTEQLALACFAEYVLYLTIVNPDMMYIHKDTGLINIYYFKFDVYGITGDLEVNRPVPFRLTPNIAEFLGPLNISGPLSASIISAARCLDRPNFKFQTILKAILRDEMIAHHKKLITLKQSENNVYIQGNTSTSSCDIDSQAIINMVTRAVSSITTRLNTLSNFDGMENKVSTLISAANNPIHLCLMDPAWHPWL